MIVKELLPAISSQLNDEENSWLNMVLADIASSEDALNCFLTHSAVVKRHISANVSSSKQVLAHFESDELIRLVLMLWLFEQHPEHYNKADIKAYYQFADSAEKCALLKSLPFIDPDGIAINLAIMAGRCNSVDEFSALALNNTYVAKFFPELNFNQTVLKALFLGLAIDDVIDLDARKNVSLSNMCFSYAVEQALAERIPPASLWLAINDKQLTAEHKADFVKYAQHFYQTSPEHKLVLTQLIAQNNITNFLTLE